ncbi:hypothetical protein EV649_0524 [Kribbella sp. VKM Ac-2569]|uniref:hypothetical protein n=1 Tax=Kribbella sp. VKM Ac-2569 TaxID=2512220 RepID=UPI00102CC7C5|nr:hypothetical protein [Kribbella sp. VKM Ac-2569]RZT26777.1 hypothetical protein EV649_0524 [Kribbella sp. VKM Ac-2569]
MLPYIGSGPYCYSNSLAMILGDQAPSPAVIEVLTGSPFGVQLISGRLPLFDPYGWDGEIGLDAAIDLLGWTCTSAGASSPAEALDRLRTAVLDGPVLVGPLEMGLLLYHPGAGEPIEADHYLVVQAMDSDRVLLHDPQGFPYATLPLDAFLASWRAESISYKRYSYSMRSGFQQVRDVSVEDALQASVPAARAWVSLRGDVVVSPGTVGNEEALERFAELLEQGMDPGIHGLMTHFAVRVGTRRLVDAATAMGRIGLRDASAILDTQARLVGSLQYELTAGSMSAAAAIVRKLQPTYAELARVL